MSIDRREFIRSAGAAAGGIAVTVSMPWLAAPVRAAQPTLATPGDFHIDDMCGAYPRYSERIDYPRPLEPETPLAAAAGSIDTLFLV